MLFQVIKDRKIMFQTEHESCVPSEKMQAAMKKAGYKIKIKDDKKCEELKMNV